MSDAGRSMASKAPTVADVAAVAGVSAMTVSRVINRKVTVAPDTRERVLAAMKALEYRPNSMARGLASGRSHTIGVLAFDTMLWGPSAALHGIELAARDRGYAVTISHLSASLGDAVSAGLRMLRTHSADGLILLQSQDGELRSDTVASTVPIVAIHSSVRDSYPLVSVDQRHGAWMATDHLLGLGHRTVAHISGPESWFEADERILGWRDALAAAGAPEIPHVAGDWSARSGYQAAQVLLENPDVTAIFAGNDTMALGALHALHERGLSCPTDVSLVGFDDIPEAEFFTPGLTTLRQDFDEVGRLSVELLIDLIENQVTVGAPTRIEPTLVVRASSAPWRGRD